MSPEYYEHELVMEPFAFTLPEYWTAEIQADGAYISILGEDATLVMTLQVSSALPEEDSDGLPDYEVLTTEEGIQIYNIGCGGPYYCGNLAYQDQAYDYTFDFRMPEAEGRVAEDPLPPESIVTLEELEAFISTVHLAK